MTPLVAYKTGRKLGRLAPYPGQIIGYGKRGPIRAVFGGTGPVVVQFVDITNASSGNYTSNITAGNSVFVWVQAYDTANSPISTSAVTVAGQSLTKLIEINTPYNGQLQYFSIWGAANSPGGAKTVSATMSGGIINPGSGLKVMEVSGLGKNWIVDRTVSASSGTGTAVASGSTSATRYANELVLYALAVANGTTGTPTGPATNSDMGGFPYFWNDYTVATTSGSTYSISATQSSTGPWAAAALTISAQVIVSSGGPKLKKLKVAGASTEKSAATGAIALKKMVVAGSGAEKFVATVAISLKKLKIAGSGSISGQSGVTVSAAINLKKMVVAGSSTEKSAATGTVSLKKMVVAGSSTEKSSASGAISLKKMVVAGSSTEKSSGTGTIKLKKMVVAGASTEKSVATGAVKLKKMVVAGTSTEKSVATAAIKLKKMVVLGSEFEVARFSGGASLKKMVVAGSSTEKSAATASLHLKKMVVAGTSIEKTVAVGSIHLKKMRISGSSTEKSVATLTLQLKKLRVSASGAQGHTAARSSPLFIFSPL